MLMCTACAMSVFQNTPVHTVRGRKRNKRECLCRALRPPEALHHPRSRCRWQFLVNICFQERLLSSHAAIFVTFYHLPVLFVLNSSYPVSSPHFLR